MKNFLATITALTLMIITCNTADAITISTSASVWDEYAWKGPPPTLTDESDGLKLTASSYRGGVDAFSETANFQNATINLKWKVDSDGGLAGDMWSAFYVGIGEWDAVATHHVIAAYDWFSTDHEWGGSSRIYEDTWYYTTIQITADREYNIWTSPGGYDAPTGYLANGDLDDSKWEMLSDASIWIGINDNYAGPPNLPSITLGEGSYNPIPEPATMLLLGSGLIGLAGFRRKFRKS